MRRLMFAAGIAAALILSACTPFSDTGGPPSTTPAVSASVELKGTKALYAAEAAFQGVLLAADAAVDNGLLKGDNAARVSAGLRTAQQALLVARQFQAHNTDPTERALAVLNAVGGVQAILSSLKK